MLTGKLRNQVDRRRMSRTMFRSILQSNTGRHIDLFDCDSDAIRSVEMT